MISEPVEVVQAVEGAVEPPLVEGGGTSWTKALSGGLAGDESGVGPSGVVNAFNVFLFVLTPCPRARERLSATLAVLAVSFKAVRSTSKSVAKLSTFFSVLESFAGAEF